MLSEISKYFPATHRTLRSIADRLGIKSLNTLRKRIKKYGLPVMRFGRFYELDEGIYQEFLRRAKQEAIKREKKESEDSV